MGTLYLVATPIGNLADFSMRAVEVLQNVSLIACEDTRTSGRLLKHYNIETPLLSFHQHNEKKKTARLMEHLEHGKDVALITDAGSPGISDPGFLPARAAHLNGYDVRVIPGPSAAITALTVSGLPAHRFFFEGFLPTAKGRSTRLDALVEMNQTVILFESVHRIKKLVKEIEKRCEKERVMAVCRELTKQFEEVIRGPVPIVSEKIQNHTRLKGEFVVILAEKKYKDC